MLNQSFYFYASLSLPIHYLCNNSLIHTPLHINNSLNFEHFTSPETETNLIYIYNANTYKIYTETN